MEKRHTERTTNASDDEESVDGYDVADGTQSERSSSSRSSPGSCSEAVVRRAATGMKVWMDAQMQGHKGDGVEEANLRLRRLRQVSTAVLVAAHIGLQVFVVFHHRYSPDSDTPADGLWEISVKGVSALIALVCFLSFEWMRRDSSQLTRQARWVLLLLYIQELLESCIWASDLHDMRVLRTSVASAVCGLQYYAALGAVQHRVEFAEEAFGAPLGSRAIYFLRVAAAVPDWVIAAVGLVGPLASRGWSPDWMRSLRACPWRNLAVCLVWTLSMLAVGQSFTLLRVALNARLARRVGTYVHAEARWARAVVGRMGAASVCSCSVYCFVSAWFTVFTFLRCIHAQPDWPVPPDGWAANAVASCLETVVEFTCLLIMVGFFRPVRPEILIRRTHSSTALVTVDCHNSAWNRQVRSLAERSLDVGALLDFYHKLTCEGMMQGGFDPWQHTTNDVVRAAIIPSTRTATGGVAYSSMLRPTASSASVMPHRMVTHTWTNLFLHLVAAVVADALGLNEYKKVAFLLSAHGTQTLREQLLAAGTLNRRYWICAFCVNQHANICGGFGTPPPPGTPAYERWDACRRNTATGELHPLCNCEERKFFNDSPDECELNKFDDMMALLHNSVRDFYQVLAVDAKFETFTRLWCVAEFVQAYLSGIRQNVCLMTNAVLEVDSGDLSIYTKLATLTVAECHATRPEDKDALLAKIPNLIDFDAQLQAVIFGERGLLGERLVGFDVLHAAARSAFRVRAASCMSESSDPERGEASE